MPILITGVAGFIGSAVALQLLEQGHSVVGLDNLNDYYDVQLKKNRLAQYSSNPRFHFHLMNIVDRQAMTDLFVQHDFDTVIHLAAQAGVRYSLQNPAVYVDSNLVGFANILEASRQHQIKHFIYASSSSVYGANSKLPFSEHDAVDHPVSLYAATKRANELMAHSYANYLPCTGLRFFTVYGPWSRPDMALISFTHNIMQGKPIQVFNQGKMLRDFTYVDDIVTSIVKVMDKIPSKSPASSHSNPGNSQYAHHKIYNVGNQNPVELIHYIRVLEDCLKKKAKLEMMPMQAGDVPNTYADVSNLENLIGVLPHTSIEEGIAKFVDWYRGYYRDFN